MLKTEGYDHEARCSDIIGDIIEKKMPEMIRSYIENIIANSIQSARTY